MSKEAKPFNIHTAATEVVNTAILNLVDNLAQEAESSQKRFEKCRCRHCKHQAESRKREHEQAIELFIGVILEHSSNFSYMFKYM